jgi:hypothetical protein
MPVTLEKMLAELSDDDRVAVEARATELIAEEMTLRDLRKAMHLTQEQLATELRMTQDGVSRLERRSDLRISTLRSFVEAMGGAVHFVVSFPGRPPVRLTGLDKLEPGDDRRRGGV